jgi:hypothetical protein
LTAPRTMAMVTIGTVAKILFIGISLCGSAPASWFNDRGCRGVPHRNDLRGRLLNKHYCDAGGGTGRA